jgi:N-acetylglutamate synthase-like GNAT family acetyltransferase
MNVAAYRARRATIEDLPALTALWQTMRFPAGELERCLTEFQVAVDANGTVLGAIGFQVAGKNALIHSEAYTDFGLADQLRPLLWERLQMVAANHGIVRVWTRETAPYWTQIGLTRANDEALAKLPLVWKGQPGELLVIKLREDVEEVLSADKEFEMFKQSEHARSAAALNTAKGLQKFATVLALLLAVLVMAGLAYMNRANLAAFFRK